MFRQNSISPGSSWYEYSVADRPAYSILTDNIVCDIAIVGGGFTGLSAALNLAKSGLKVVLLDAARFGDGASGRNGGQLGTGQRQWVETLEKYYGYERTKVLFDLTEEAKNDILQFCRIGDVDIDYVQGHLSLVHKKREIKAYQSHVETMCRYGYNHLTFMDKAETADRLGSDFYHAGIRDVGTGHINPLKFVIALAKAADKAGALLYENTLVTALERSEGKCVLTTSKAQIKADRVLLASNGYHLGFRSGVEKYIVPIRSYIGATSPLSIDSEILRGGESVDDSRFVVRYFRKSADNRLLFGGAESYDRQVPNDLEIRIRRQASEVFPKLKQIALSHYWGGTVAITVERMPFIRDIMPGVTYCGGYSGHGVMMAPFVGKLYAESVCGKSDRINLLKDLHISAFPGGSWLRRPLLFLAMQWFALMDRF